MIAPARALLLGLLVTLGGPGARAASGPAVEAENGMVVSSQRLASQVGADILKPAATPSMPRWRWPMPKRW